MNENKKCVNKTNGRKSGYKGKNNGKSRSNRNRQFDPSEEAKKQIDQQDYNNDPSMYFKDRELASQVSTFSFNQFLTVTGHVFDGNLENVSIPAICCMYFNPSVGYTRGTNTSDGGINIASMKGYTWLSANNAKNTNYGPQDVGMLEIALGDVISQVEYIRRAFRTAFLYNKRNWAYPQALIAAMGIDYQDFIRNLAGYRLQFNATINMLNQISFPGDFEWMRKCATMYSHIYTDSKSPMSGTYLFLPATTWTIDETTSQEGTMLKTTPACLALDGTTRTRTMSQILTELTTQIQAILNSATFNYIYADVLRLVDGGRLLTMPYLTEGETIEPEYDPMINLQINNMNVIRMPEASAVSEQVTSYNDVMIKAENNTIFYAPRLVVAEGEAALNRAVLNFPHSMGDPDVDQRIESTRMLTLFEGDSTATEYAAIADHYCVGWAMYKGQTTIGVYRPSTLRKATFSTEGGLEIISDLTKFEDIFRVYATDPTDNSVDFIIGDLDYFTDIDVDYLKRVDDLAYANLFSLTDK